MTTVDRSACAGTRHGDESAYSNFGCRCDDARHDARTKTKLRQAGLHPSPYVSAVGTARRLQAMAALGHSGVSIAAEMGCTPQRVDQLRNGRLKRVRRETAERVSRIYDRRWDTPGDSEVTRDRAARAGWAPPLAWDDDTIDDPTAQPNLGEQPPKQQGIDLAEVAHLEAGGVSLHEIAKRLHVKVATIQDARSRVRRRHRRTHSWGEAGQVAS